MTKEELGKRIAKELEITQKKAAMFFDVLFDSAKESIKENGEFTIPGIVKLKVWKRSALKARPGRNPKTGKVCTIPARPARKAFRIHATKMFKEATIDK